ncbi:MAG TPA: ABC transporter permease [Actinomycetota bacterium]|jgi:NitT/TauT family transport system permease protein
MTQPPDVMGSTVAGTAEAAFVPPALPAVEPLVPRAAMPVRRRRPVLLSIREDIPERVRWTLVVASVAVPLLAWVGLSATGAVSPIFLPSPAAVIRAFGELWSSGVLAGDVGATMTRVGIGFALVVVVSVPLGLAMGSFASAKAFFEPMIGLVRYMPATAFIPLLMIWLGIGEANKIALLFIGTVFFNTLMSADVAALVPKNLIDASYTLGASRLVVIRKVVLPHSVPGLIDAMRVNLAATFNLVVVAELLASQEGLGYRIIRSQRGLHTDAIFALLIVIGVIGVGMDFGFRFLRNAMAPWAKPTAR